MLRARKYRLISCGKQRRERIEIDNRLIPGEKIYRATVEVEGQARSRKIGLIAKSAEPDKLRDEYFQLRKLKKLGCDVIPTFYLADSPKGRMLLKTDLTFGGKNIVFDLASIMDTGISPWRRQQLTKRERKRFDEFLERARENGQVIDLLPNKQEVMEKILRNQRIATEAGLYITGDAWQLSVDPKTLRGTIYITEKGFHKIEKHLGKEILKSFEADLHNL